MRTIRQILVVLALTIGLTAFGFFLGSQFHYVGAVAHFSSDPYKSYIDVEALTYAPDGFILGLIGGLFFGLILVMEMEEGGR